MQAIVCSFFFIGLTALSGKMPAKFPVRREKSEMGPIRRNGRSVEGERHRLEMGSLLIGGLALLFAWAGSIVAHAEVISVPSADPSSAASPPPPTVLRGSPPAAVKPVPTCPPGYALSSGYGCIGPSSSDYPEGGPGYDYWPGYGYGYSLGGFPVFGLGAGRFPRFGSFHDGRFHAGRRFRGPAAFHGSARFGRFGAGTGHMGGFGRR